MKTSPWDALLPRDMAKKAEEVGARKAAMPAGQLFVLAVLAGAFIALGAIFATVAGTGGEALPYGIKKAFSGLVFSLGLILVVVAGAELFTGNNLIVMAWASGRISAARVLRNWSIVYVGNLVGAVLTACVMLATEQYTSAGGAVGVTALNIAEAKCRLGFVQGFALGILCNALVCLAVWLCFSARSVADKVLAIVFPITAFVAAGFEHCIANMYFIPMGILIKSGAKDTFWIEASQVPADYPALGMKGFLVDNLIPVTLGNIVGGAVMVGLVYWFVYLKGETAAKP